MRNIKKKDNEQWIELCEYVKKEILEYDDNMKFPQYQNEELKSKGFLTISGRVNKQYFMERTCYGAVQKER